MAQCTRCKSNLPADAIYCPSCGKKQEQEKRKSLKRANGTGTVYKLQGRRRKPWVAAKNKVIIGYYERKTDAIEALEHITGKSLTERYNMTFTEVYLGWKEEHERSVSEKTMGAYTHAYAIFESLHDRKFRDIRTHDYQQIIDQHFEKSHSTVSQYKQLVTQMSRWAIREEIITTNFAQFIQVPKAQTKEKEIFSDSEIDLLIADDSEAAKIVLMLIYTGMRIGELFSLPLEDYHGRYVIGGEKTKAGRNRVIPIRPEGRPYFEYFAYQATGTLLLSGYVGQHTSKNFRQRDYYPLLERLGIKRKTPHSTRHTYASWAVSAGIAPEILQRILGHVNYSTTADIYVHSDIDKLVQSVEKC